MLIFIGTILAIVFWMMKRHASKVDDPLEANRKRYEEIDAQIARGDSVALTIGASADLDELDILQNPRGPSAG